MNLPIDITNKNPNTFSFTSAELNLTPVTANNNVVKIPLMTDYFYDEGEYIHVGNTPQASIWIGKNASLTLIMGHGGETHRHEINCLAFEDGRSSLTANIQTGVFPCEDENYSEYDYDDPNRPDTSFQNANGDFLYDLATISDVTSTSNVTSWTEGDLSMMAITKSLRLPEGITNFGRFNFCHTYFDKTSNRDYYHHTPTDFHIVIPSTVTSFVIDTDNYINISNYSNILYFGWLYNGISYPIWTGEAEDNTSSSGCPNYPSEDDEDSSLYEYLEDTPHDVVHIYLRNHTSVPNITFLGDLYFPIVFHVNKNIEADFKARYLKTIPFKPSWDIWFSLDYYDPISVVGDFGTYPEVIEGNTVEKTNFSPVALSGSYSDLKNNPIPDAPTTDGNYVLKVTVSNGEPTYTWISSNS